MSTKEIVNEASQTQPSVKHVEQWCEFTRFTQIAQSLKLCSEKT